MRVFSFLSTVMLLNGVEITGWADGDDVIQISRFSDSASHKIGAGGEMMVSLSSDKSGKFTFKLQQTSSSNKYINGLCAAMEGGPGTFIPVNALFQDTNRNDRASGSIGYILKPADLTRGAQANNQEWSIVVERLDLLLGDPVLAGIPIAAAILGV